MNRLLAICVALFTATVALAQSQRPVTFEDLDGVKTGESFVGVTLDLSPSGTQIASEYGRRLKILDAKSGKQLHDLGEGILPLFSRAGDRLAFYSTRSGVMQLWLWSVKDGSVRQLTHFPEGVDPDPTTRVMGYVIDAYRIDWSPDGRQLVFGSRVAYPDGRKPGAPLVLDNHTAGELTLSGLFAQPGVGQGGVAASPDGRRFVARAAKAGERLVSRIFAIDLASGEVKVLPGGAGHLFHPVFSPDGKRVAYAAIADNDSVVTSRAGEIRVLDWATGQESVLAGGKEFKHRPQWSPDGLRMAYLTGSYSEYPQIEVVNVRDGSRVHHYAFGKLISKYEWMRQGDGLWVAYASEGAKFGRLSFANGALEKLQDGVGAWWSQSDNGLFAWAEGHAGPGIFTAANGAAKPNKVLDLTPPAQTATLKLGRIEDIPYRTKRGFDLQGKLLYPPDYQAGKKYPLIVDAYPINSGSMWMFPMGGNQAWGAAGYMVFKANQARGPHVVANCSGAADYCAASKGPEAWDVMVDDVMSGVDELIRRGLVDGDRMCAFGHSNGGGVVDYLITQTDRFKCAVSVAPVWPNWVGAPLLGGWWESMTEFTGISPLDNPEAYIKLSAVFQTRKVTTPVLLMVGDQDGGFLLGAIEMYNSLRYAGAPVTLVRYPDQGHVFEGEPLRDFWNRTMAFFAEHLPAGKL